MFSLRLKVFLLLTLATGLTVAGLRWRASQPFATAPEQIETVQLTANAGPGGRMNEPPPPPPLLSADPYHTAPAYFDPDLIDPETLDGAVHADALVITRPRDPAIPGAAAAPPPATLADPPDALPIDERTAQAARDLDDLVDRELADLPEEERQVWHNVLQGMPIEQAEELLQIWKLTGGPHQHANAAASMTASLPDAGADSNAPHAPPDHPAATLNADDVALAIEHLRHADVPGYRRCEQTAQGTRLIDLTPGALRSTGNPLHAAINGEGFFILQRDGRTAVTRCGRFDLSSEGDLILRRADGDWMFAPSIRLPADSKRLLIRTNGAVFALLGDDSEKEIGAIELATFLNPQHLATLDGELLQETPQSGPLQRAAPGRNFTGMLRSGVLEGSNVDAERELQRLDNREQVQRLEQQGRLAESPQPLRTHNAPSVLR